MNNAYYENMITQSFKRLNYKKLCNDILKTDASRVASEKRLKDMLSPQLETKALAYTLTRLMIFLYEKGNTGISLPEWADKFNTFIENKFGNTDDILSVLMNLNATQKESQTPKTKTDSA